MSTLPLALSLNPFSQRVLAQSVNLSYAGRGAYRVSDTQPSRKGDYWFRDFGMVMACTYMTEMGFRGTERFYTMPLLTDALQLHALRTPNYGQKRAVPGDATGLRKLDSRHLYPQAMNYGEMPEVLRQKMMGTLIRNSSELVPQVLRQDALNEIATLKDKNGAFQDQLKALIETPLAPNNTRFVPGYIQGKGLQAVEADLFRIAKIDNKAIQQSEIAKLLNSKPNLQETSVQDGVRLIKTQQLGYLLNHLDRTLNFRHYLESNFLQPKTKAVAREFEMPPALQRKNRYSPVSEMGEVVADRMAFYADKLHTLQTQAKGELIKVAEAVRKLPQDQRALAFTERIRAVEDMALLYKKESMLDSWNVPGTEKSDRAEVEAIYDQLSDYKNNIDRKSSFKDKFGKPREGWINWQEDFNRKKSELSEFLSGQERITPKALTQQLTHFDGLFEQVGKDKLDIKQRQLEKLWHHLGGDLLLHIKKKIKVAAEEINKIPFDQLPELKSSIERRLKNPNAPVERVANKAQLLEARLIDMGLLKKDHGWLEPAQLKTLSESITQHLQQPADFERHTTQGVMDKVKKEIFGQLTLFDKKTGKEGHLFSMLTGEGGLEKLLAPLFKGESYLHQVNGKPSLEWTVKSLILDGTQSKVIKAAVERIQKNGTWPKMVATVALNFIFYGWLASRFDNKILQPYEEKLVARKGTSQDIVNAGYLGLLPGLAVLSQLWDTKATLPVLKKLNHFSRFASVGSVALGVFAGSTYGFLRVLDKKTPPLPGWNPNKGVSPLPFSANVSQFSRSIQPGFAPNRGFGAFNPVRQPLAYRGPQPFQPFQQQPFNRPVSLPGSPFVLPRA